MKEITTNEVKYSVDRALTKLLQNDSLLVELNANERSITHKLAEYLQLEFAAWNVDCEYNRNWARSRGCQCQREAFARMT